MPDTVLGGGTKTRAQARRQFQEFLESGKAYPDRPPLTPDQATQLLGKWETNSRNMVLNDFGKQLQAAGVSAPGVERALDEVRGGKTPAQVFREAADGLSNYGGALGGALRVTRVPCHTASTGVKTPQSGRKQTRKPWKASAAS